MSDWISVKDRLPEPGQVVDTKIDDGVFVMRNEGPLKLIGNLWFYTDGSVYVYYEPTHWREIEGK
jgi:hypothetical protein